MRKLKLTLCLAFIAIFGAFELLHTDGVAGQTGGTPLSAPTGITASDNIYNNKVGIYWDAIRGATNYRIFRNTTNTPATAIDVGTTPANSFFDFGATPSQTVFYWVRAENSSSVSSLSLSDQGIRANAVQQGPIPPLDPPPVPPANPITAAKTYLGKTLFWDEQMSTSRTVSCGSCHFATNGGTDKRSVTAATASLNAGPDGLLNTADDIRGSMGVPFTNPDGTYLFTAPYGVNDQVTGRKTVSFVDAGYSPTLFWDGRATPQFRDPITNAVIINAGAALESQVLGPPTSTTEMGHSGRSWTDVASRISDVKPLALSPSIPSALATWINGRSYSELFTEAFGTPEVSPAKIAMAIATYERTLYSDQTPLDLANAGITPLTQTEQRGRNVFATPGNGCAGCHAGATTSDNAFHYTGVRPTNDDTGRFQVTGNTNNLGEFRTPGLRNLELRGSFLHNGQLTTIEQVVAFYNRGGNFNAPNKAPAVHPLGLSPQQQSDLVAFLKRPLTDPRVAAGLPPFDRPSLYTESNRVPQNTGLSRAGIGGFVPQIKIISPPVQGNPTFTVSLSAAPGNAAGFLIISTTDNGTRIPASNGRSLFPRINLTTANTGAGNGWASVTFALPEAATAGQTYYTRWYIEDPTVKGGYAISQASKFTIFAPAITLASVFLDVNVDVAVDILTDRREILPSKTDQ